MNELQEPILTWSLFVTLVIVPIGLFLLFLGIKRLFAKKDKEDTRKDDIIADLVRSKECAQKRELENTHASMTAQINDLRHLTEETNKVLFAKLEGIYNQLKVANGRTAKLEAAHAALRAVHDERHNRRVTDALYPPPEVNGDC